MNNNFNKKYLLLISCVKLDIRSITKRKLSIYKLKNLFSYICFFIIIFIFNFPFFNSYIYIKYLKGGFSISIIAFIFFLYAHKIFHTCKNN